MKRELKKQKYLITLPGDELFSFAGLWSQWVNKETGEIIKSYTIITTEANPLMREIHNSKKRMPIVLTRDNEQKWINGQAVMDFAHPELDFISCIIAVQ